MKGSDLYFFTATKKLVYLICMLLLHLRFYQILVQLSKNPHILMKGGSWQFVVVGAAALLNQCSASVAVHAELAAF